MTEDKKEKHEVKEDSLMWSEEDYDSVQKMTGFDDESILEDQKKGINIIILVVICIVCLTAGIVIGYNINKKSTPEPTTYTDEPKVIVPTIASAYTRLNESNELYLYIVSSIDEEFSVMQLNDSNYHYDIEGADLYILIDNDGLNLYKYSFDRNGYHRELATSFNDRYQAFYYKNGFVLIKRENYARMYNKTGVLYKEIETNIKNILDYTEDYIVYESDTSLNVYNIKTDEIKVITDKEYKFLLYSDNQVFYLEEGKIYNYDIIKDSTNEIAEVKSTNIFAKVKDHYLYNDGKDLYISDTSIIKMKEFNNEINELAYLDKDNIIFILDDYDIENCALKENEYYVYNINTKSMTTKKISGCLKTIIINDLVVSK